MVKRVSSLAPLLSLFCSLSYICTARRSLMTERSERMSEEAAYRLFLSGTLPLGYSILILFFFLLPGEVT